MTRMIHTALVAALLLATGCMTFNYVGPGEDGKLLVAYQRGALGFYSGGIYECVKKGAEMDCKELPLLLPDAPTQKPR